MITGAVPLRGISQSETKKISPGAKRHVRRQKSRIRREYVHTDEIKERIEKIYASFKSNSAVSRIDKLAPSGTKTDSPRKRRGQIE